MAVNRAVQPNKNVGKPLDTFELVTIPKPKASPNNVVVRVVLRPVNLCDIIIPQWGSWANIDPKDIVIGSEGVGFIEEVGEEITKFSVGQRVIPLIWNRYVIDGYGLWRDYVEVPEIDLLAVPDHIDDESAAQFLIYPWTAYGILRQLNVPKGEHYLQTAASSHLGREMIALCKHYGIQSINVVRREAWVKPLKDLGADYVIDSSTEDVTAKVMEITGGKGAYAGSDPIAGEAAGVAASCIRAGGELLLYGVMSGDTATFKVKDLIRKISIGFFSISDHNDNLPLRLNFVQEIFDLMAKKVIAPPKAEATIYPMEQFKEAVKASLEYGREGKVLLASN